MGFFNGALIIVTRIKPDMKPTHLIVIGLWILGCQPPSGSTDPITNEDARNLLNKWEEALKTKDTTMLGEVLHPEYRYSGSPDGSITTRRKMLEGLQNDPYTILAQNLYDLDFRLYDDVAVVRGWEILSLVTGDGDTSEFKLRFTDVYRKENGVTRALATHSSPIEE